MSETAMQVVDVIRRISPKERPQELQPEYWTNLWGCELLAAIPVSGFATAATWRGMTSGTTRAPGKNHPLAGAWLIDQYCPEDGVCVDPMFGAGGLWIKADVTRVGSLEGCEIEGTLCGLGRSNLQQQSLKCADLSHADAVAWRPRRSPDLVLFSPPFLQNHSAGSNAHQQAIRERKSLHSMQEFGGHVENLGTKKPDAYWDSIARLYENVSSYVNRRGSVVVILRNRILRGCEIDEVGRHINLMRAAGLTITGAHVRDLVRPTGYQAWKVARDPNIPWIRYEWAIAAQPSS